MHAINLDLHAKRRLIRYLNSEPWNWHVRRQVHKAADRLWNGDSMLFRAVTEGPWGAQSATLAPLLPLDQLMWRTLCVIGAIGCIVLGLRRWSYALHAAFLCYYAIVFCAAPVSARIAIQVAPTLCLFAAALLASLATDRRITRTGPANGKPNDREAPEAERSESG